MARKNKEEKVNANNLRTANFADFEATHEFTPESKKADFMRAAIQAGLTNDEIVEIGDTIYGEGGTKTTCINWYRSSDPVLNPGKERYKATGAKALEVKAKVLNYYNELDDAGKVEFVNKLMEAVGIESIINGSKVETLKTIVPAELFPAKIKIKKEMTEADKLIKKQKALEEKAAKLREQLAALQNGEATEAVQGEQPAEV